MIPDRRHPEGTRRPAGGARVVSFLLVAALSASALSAGSRSDDVEALLARLREESCLPEGIERELVALGPEALPQLFGALVDRGDAVEPSEVRAREVRVLQGAITRLPRKDVRRFIAVSPATRERGQARVTAIRVLGRVGRGEDVPLLMELAAPASDQEPLDPAAASALADATRQILDCDLDGLFELEHAYPYAHPRLKLGIVEAIGEAGREESLRALGRLLGVTEEADAFVLREIERLALALPLSRDEELLRAARRYLAAADPRLVAQACRLARILRDEEAVEELIGLVESPEPEVRKTALAALGELTGQNIGPNKEQWSRWYGWELAWWLGRSDESLEALRSRERAEVAAAVQQLSRRWLFRDELVEPIAELLQGRDVTTVRLAVAALAGFGTELAADELLGVMDHPDQAIREAACQGLRRITGWNLACDAHLWRSALADS